MHGARITRATIALEKKIKYAESPRFIFEKLSDNEHLLTSN